MITGYEIGAVFRILDEATGPLRKILESVRALNKAITGARENLAGFSGVVAPGLAGAITETNSLAAAWTRVGESAAAAAKVVASSAAASARSAAASVPTAGVAAGAATAAVGGGGGFRPGIGGAHITGPGVGLPGGSHARLGGTPMAVGAGLAAYGIYEAANMEDAVWQLIYHSGQKNTKENKDRFRKIIEEGMKATGYGLKEVAGAAIQDVRLMQCTPGGGLEQLPETLKIAAVEARLKGTTLKESMTAIVEFAHMFKAYSPQAIAKLAPVFAFLSTANPKSLPQMVGAAGYAVPILESSMGIDPVTTALLSTALTRAGITSTKAGTWLRELGTRGLPTGKAKHDDALKRLNLVDAEGKPTWFTNGKPDIEKAIDIGSRAAAEIPVAERPGVMRQAFGVQGAGALAVLGDPKVNEQIHQLRKDMDSPEFKNRYGTALESYGENSPVQQARTTLQNFNVSMVELAEKALPVATAAMSVFSKALEGLGVIQEATPKGDKPIGLPMQRSVVPRAWNYFFGPKETEGVLKPPSPGTGDDPKKMNFLQGPSPSITVKPQPITLNLNVDGRTLATAVAEQIANGSSVPTQAPAFDGMGQYVGGDHNHPDK
jgi:hypothetical protein